MFIFRGVYFYCESAKQTEKGYDFEIKSYSPANLNLQEIAKQLTAAAESPGYDSRPWVNYFRDGLNILNNQPETDFKQPNAETDKLYMSIGERDLIEVAHPIPLDDSALKR